MGGCFSCFPSHTEEAHEREVTRYTSRKIRPSDEDRGRYVGEPDIDEKAGDFITKVRENLSKNPDEK